MFTHEPDFFRKFAIWVGKVSFIKKLLRPVYNKYTSSLEKNRRDLFIKNGVYVLSLFDDCLTKLDIPYCLAFGSMLGAVREHGYIKHDLDLDVVIWSEDYSERMRTLLFKKGFKLYRDMVVENGDLGREETYELKGVTIDVFYIYPAIDQYPYCCDFVPEKDSISLEDSMDKYGHIISRRIQLPWKKEFERVPFESLQLPIPVNAHEILSFRYGDDYMKPNPQWHYTDANKYITTWNEALSVLKH